MCLRFSVFAPALFIVFFVKKTYAQQYGTKFHFSFQQHAVDRNPSFTWFLKYFREEENKIENLGELDSSEKLTLLRKIYYDSPSFDKFLIKTSKKSNVKTRSTKQVIRENYIRSVPTGSGLRFHLDDLISVPSDESGTISVLRKDPVWSQEIALDSNSVIDIGHVLCGMDAANYPSSVRFPFPLRFIKIDSNADAITWIGDLGSVVSEYYYHQKVQGAKLSDDQLQLLIDEYASAADNLGNVHSKILSERRTQMKEKLPYSDLIENFYLEQDYPSDSLRKSSFLYFAKAIGLEWNGTAFKNVEVMKRKYSKEVGNAAAMYLAVAARRKGNLNLLIAFPSILKLRKQKITVVLVEKFFNALQQEIIQNQQISSR